MRMVRHRILETYADHVEYMYTPEGVSFVNPKNLEAVEPHLPFLLPGRSQAGWNPGVLDKAIHLIQTSRSLRF